MHRAIDAYRQLRAEVDRIAARLEAIHGGEIVCRQGCWDCCRNLTVWPVEFFAIVEEMKAAGVPKPEFDPETSCGFLKGGLCWIYPFRPLICRTHGLPIAFENSDAEPPEMSVSFCPKSFKDWEEKGISFGPGNTLNIDLVNQELSRIHEAFLEESKNENLKSCTRIELKEILDFI